MSTAEDFRKSLVLAQDLLDRNRRLLVITGAGVSTGSGIGDYRDDQGEWKRGKPIMHQDFVAEASARRRYWARSQVGYPEFARARPNLVHERLAQWERSERLVGLITQNVDRLHQRAGHRRVIDLHGRLDRVVCLECGAVVPRATLQVWLEAANPDVREDFYRPAPDGDADLERSDFDGVRTPTCACGGTMKPDVVFFGDSVPRAVVDESYRWVEEADLLLAIGSSLMVFSSFRFVRRAHELGKPILIVNRGHTRADDLATAIVRADCAAAVSELRL